jgi:glycosyltransferase involved in cell wall biosynthesis
VQPVFSIATPTRNRLPDLRRCVGSVRGQQAPLEHLIQDAASTDGTPQWLAAQADLRAVSEADDGMYDAINRAWARSGGSYLSWLNSDEQYLPGTLHAVERYFGTHPEVDVVTGYAIVVGPDGSPLALRRDAPFRRAYVVNGFLHVMSCTAFFRRRLYESGLLRFDPAYRSAGDADLMLSLSRAGARFGRIPRTLSLFGVDGTNLSGQPIAAEELARIRRKYGAFRSPWARALVTGVRRLERFLRGDYFPADLEYRFATDEVPRYVTIRSKAVSGRYALQDADQGAIRRA